MDLKYIAWFLSTLHLEAAEKSISSASVSRNQVSLVCVCSVTYMALTNERLDESSLLAPKFFCQFNRSTSFFLPFIPFCDILMILLKINMEHTIKRKNLLDTYTVGTCWLNVGLNFYCTANQLWSWARQSSICAVFLHLYNGDDQLTT